MYDNTNKNITPFLNNETYLNYTDYKMVLQKLSLFQYRNRQGTCVVKDIKTLISKQCYGEEKYFSAPYYPSLEY